MINLTEQTATDIVRVIGVVLLEHKLPRTLVAGEIRQVTSNYCGVDYTYEIEHVVSGSDGRRVWRILGCNWIFLYVVDETSEPEVRFYACGDMQAFRQFATMVLLLKPRLPPPQS